MTNQHHVEAMQTRRRWPMLVVALVTIIVFARVCSYDFSWWDDTSTVHHNPWFQKSAPVALRHYWSSSENGLYIPVTYTAWIGLAAVSRLQQADSKDISLNPWIFHSANVAAHLCSALLAFVFLRMLVKKDIAACLGAILFAVHPVQVESVAWVSGLKDVLAGCLSLAALCRYVRCAQGDSARPVVPDALGTICFVAAMLAKPSASMVAPIALCIDHFIVGRNWRIALRASAIWIVLAIPILIVARIAQFVPENITSPIYLRPFIAADTLTFYLYKIICPIWLGLDYGRRPLVMMHHVWTYLSWLVLLALVLLAWRSRRPWLLATGAIFGLAILPVCGIFRFEFQQYSTTADHYLYFAMIAPAMALAFAVREWDSRTTRSAAAIVLALFAVRAFIQTAVWKDDFALFRNSIRVNPGSFVSHHNLGSTYFLAEDYDDALREFQTSMALNPDFTLSFDNAANILAMKGDVDGSIAATEHSLEVRQRMPGLRVAGYVEEQRNIGRLLMKRGEYARAIPHFQAILQATPEDSQANQDIETAREKINSPATQSPPPSAR